MVQAITSHCGRRGLTCIASSASQTSGSPAAAPLLSKAYAALAAVLAASAAARLAAPAYYVELAHSACPNGTVRALVRLTGATLIPIAAALWALKVQLLTAAHSAEDHAHPVGNIHAADTGAAALINAAKMHKGGGHDPRSSVQLRKPWAAALLGMQPASCT